MLTTYNRFEMSPIELMYLFAIFTGALIRTFAPFIRKYMAGEVEEFENQYIITFLVSYIIAFIVALAQFVVYPLPQGSEAIVFAIGFGLGIGSTTLINEAKKWFFPDED